MFWILLTFTALSKSVADPGQIGTDPDPRIRALQIFSSLTLETPSKTIFKVFLLIIF
jgi:hypothetical protein